MLAVIANDRFVYDEEPFIESSDFVVVPFRTRLAARIEIEHLCADPVLNLNKSNCRIVKHPEFNH